MRRAVHEPTLPKPWIATVDAFERLVQVARRLLDDDHDAASGRGFASERAAELDRLARDDGGRVAVALAVGVHHPGHRLRVRVQVGGRDVAVDAEDVGDRAA